MGRNTFETVMSFDCDWPYTKPVFVLSHSLNTLPEKSVGKAELIQGSPQEVIEQLNKQGMTDIYIDGGKIVQSFLQDDLVDEMVGTYIKFPFLIPNNVFSEKLVLLSFIYNPKPKLWEKNPLYRK